SSAAPCRQPPCHHDPAPIAPRSPAGVAGGRSPAPRRATWPDCRVCWECPDRSAAPAEVEGPLSGCWDSWARSGSMDRQAPPPNPPPPGGGGGCGGGPFCSQTILTKVCRVKGISFFPWGGRPPGRGDFFRGGARPKMPRPPPPCLVTAKLVLLRSREIAVVAV